MFEYVILILLYYFYSTTELTMYLVESLAQSQSLDAYNQSVSLELILISLC